MKLLGVTNGKQVLASVAHYDCRTFGDGEDYIMQDGGQNIDESFGYNRKWGKSIWFEIPQTYAELYNDWNNSLNSSRKYGIWNLADVKILTPEEYPDINSFEWRAENAIWGTNGLNGDQPTTYVLIKDCEKNHLKKISELCEKRGNKDLKEIVDYWFAKKPLIEAPAELSNKKVKLIKPIGKKYAN